MEMITNIKRWLNSRRLDRLRITMGSIDYLQHALLGVAHAYYGESPIAIGRLQIKYSTTPTEGAIAHCLVSGESFLTISEMTIKPESWQKLGIGRRLLSESIGRLKQTMPPDTVVDGLITDLDVIGFWQNFGFKFMNTGDNSGFIACRLTELRLDEYKNE